MPLPPPAFGPCAHSRQDTGRLLCGVVRGNLANFAKKAASINKANGPFDLMLCVGSSFPPDVMSPSDLALG